MALTQIGRMGTLCFAHRRDLVRKAFGTDCLVRVCSNRFSHQASQIFIRYREQKRPSIRLLLKIEGSINANMIFFAIGAVAETIDLRLQVFSDRIKETQY